MPGIKSPGDNKLKIAPNFDTLRNSIKGVDSIGIDFMKHNDVLDKFNTIESLKDINNFKSPTIDSFKKASEQLGN